MGPLVFFGSALQGDFALRLCAAMGGELNCFLAPAPAIIDFFTNGSVRVELMTSVRGRDTYVVVSECRALVDGVPRSANDHVRQALELIDALRRASAKTINVIFTYFEGRQDRRAGIESDRTPISTSVTATCIEALRATRFFAVEVHSEQALSAFDIPADRLKALKVLVPSVLAAVGEESFGVVAPDKGGFERARAFAHLLSRQRPGAEPRIAIVHKERRNAQQASVLTIENPEAIAVKTAIIVDDIIDTAGTAKAGAAKLAEVGATRILFAAVHPVLSGRAIEHIATSPIERVFVTDTIPLTDEAKKCSKISQVTIVPLLAAAMNRLISTDSVQALSDFG